jgi:hypothetical protein
MIDEILHKKNGSLWVVSLVFAITLLLTSSDLNLSTSNYIEWIVTAFALVLSLPYVFQETFFSRLNTVRRVEGTSWWAAPTRLPATLFLASICLAAVYGKDDATAMIGLGKLGVILLLGLPAIVARVRIALLAFCGILAAVWVNLVILIGGISVGGLSSGMMAPGRWGTVLNQPGALWRLAIMAWLFAAYLMVQRRSVSYLSLFIASTVLIFSDGARTSLLFLLFGVAFLLVVLGREARHPLKMMSTAQIAVLSLVGVFFAIGQGLPQQQNGFNRLLKTVTSLESGGADEADITRSAMIMEATDAIQEHPVMGTGFLSTKAETPFGPMVIHNTYLQVWADLGLLGIVSYVWLVFGWIAWLPIAVRRIRALSSDLQRAIYYNAIFLLFVFDLTGFFHPLSTEWAQWIPFLVPYSLLWNIVGRGPKTGQVNV